MGNSLIDFNNQTIAREAAQAEAQRTRNFNALQNSINRDETFAQQDQTAQTGQEFALERLKQGLQNQKDLALFQEGFRW